MLEPGLRVYKIHNGYWFFGRPTVEELRRDLRDVLHRCRPDWDIRSTEQRAAWASGTKVGFYPYRENADAGIRRTRMNHVEACVSRGQKRRRRRVSPFSAVGAAPIFRIKDRQMLWEFRAT